MIANIILGVVAFFNLAVILYKFKKERYIDGTFDIGALMALNMMFSGSLSGQIIATTASFLMSFYLFFFPPKFNFL